MLFSFISALITRTSNVEHSVVVLYHNGQLQTDLSHPFIVFAPSLAGRECAYDYHKTWQSYNLKCHGWPLGMRKGCFATALPRDMRSEHAMRTRARRERHPLYENDLVHGCQALPKSTSLDVPVKDILPPHWNINKAQKWTQHVSTPRYYL